MKRSKHTIGCRKQYWAILLLAMCAFNIAHAQEIQSAADAAKEMGGGKPWLQSLRHDSLDDCRIALKTNLLYDALLMPSLEVEYKLGGRWSVAVEGSVAWWKNSSKHKTYQIALVSPEVRYMLDAARPWSGHYFGAFTGYGWYDLENGGRGYRGGAGLLGISYGYLWPLNSRLLLEAGIGAGILFTRYKEYLPIDGHNCYQQTSHLLYGGPLKVKLALAWRLWNEGRKEGCQ